MRKKAGRETEGIKNMADEVALLVAVNAKYIHSNAAVYSLKANAGAYAEHVGIAEYTVNHLREEILQGIYRRSPEVVAFSCYIWNIRYVLDIAADLRKILPDALIVLGGPEVSYDAPRILERYPFVDLVMVGEGEATFREFLENYMGEGGSFSCIDGVCLRSGDELVLTPPRQAVEMDSLVFPYRNVKGLENRIIYYETMRGCPFSCSYCLSSIEKGVRMRSLPKVFDEIQFFLDHRVKQVKFVDRTFNCSHEHAYQIWEYIWKNDNGVTNFHFEISGDLLAEEDFELFQEFRPGLIQLEIGVQSTNRMVIKEIRRRTDLSRLAYNVSRIRKAGNIHRHLDLIAGLPYEDIDSFGRSFNEVYAMAPDQLQLGFLKVLKGSYMEEQADGYGIEYAECPPYEVLSTRWLSYDDIIILKQVEEMVEIYYNSFQFQAAMALLEQCHANAFEMFADMGKYYDVNGYFDMKHSRVARYEILWEYVRKYFPERENEFRQALTYDLYLRDYVKSPPSFVRQRSREYVEWVHAFLEKEAAQPELLCGYDGYTAKQLFHMVYVDEFTLDPELLLEQKKISTCRPRTYVFDYRKRNPLNHNACTQAIMCGLPAESGAGGGQGKLSVEARSVLPP